MGYGYPGAELPVLKGADETLKSCKFIYIEVSRGNFYEEGTQWNELKNFLIDKGFKIYGNRLIIILIFYLKSKLINFNFKFLV